MAATAQRTAGPTTGPTGMSLREPSWRGFRSAPPGLMVCASLILSGLIAIATPATPSLAQSTDTGLVAKNTGASASKKAAPNTNMTPTKHRHWRHQGGRHPHFGSRRVRT
jgi:hypothetical protein